MSRRLPLVLLVALALLGLAPACSSDPPQRRQEPTWWQPSATRPLALHWVLGGRLDVHDPRSMGLRDDRGRRLPAPEVYDIDGELNPKSTVDLLHRRGKKVICYFDAGAYETYRGDAWKFKRLKPRIWGKPDIGWNDSYWLDVRRIDELEPIMKARMRMCKRKGFDAVEPDEIDGWENSLHPRTHQPSAKHGLTGFAISYRHQLRYNRALARWAHELGLSIGQKGDLIQTRDLVGHFDWTLNEECYQYRECTRPYDPRLGKVFPGLQLYTRADKAVFIAEYVKPSAKRWRTICRDSRQRHFNTTRWALGLPKYGRRTPCSSSKRWNDDPAVAAPPDQAVALPPVHAGFDYQIGGSYPPPAGVQVVVRDREDKPAAGLYNICYVNAFQVQPGEQGQWDADLLLRDAAGDLVIDEDWDEPLLDLRTTDKRQRIAATMNGWIDGCADQGFQAIEPDNYDSFTRSKNLLSADDAKDFLKLLATHAHAKGLAIGQKNTAELAGDRRTVGLDFAVAEECGEYDECGVYAEAFDDHVVVIEYTDAGHRNACREFGDRLSIVRRDVDVTVAGTPAYVRKTC